MGHQLENSFRVLSSTHREDRCLGEHCTIHNMSDHPLRGFEQEWSGQYMERHGPNGEVWEDPDEPNPQPAPNAARCLGCGDVLYSRHRHDFKTCSCSNLSVDGGSSYMRRVYRDASLIEEIESWPVPAGWL